MKRISKAAMLALVLLATPSIGQASHYRLGESGLTSKAELQALAKVLVLTTKDLVERAGPKTPRRQLSKATRIRAARLLELAQTCDLLRIGGLGMSMARLLRAGGVLDTTALATQEPASLAQRLKAANTKYRVTEITPDPNQLKTWIARAKKLPRLIELR